MSIIDFTQVQQFKIGDKEIPRYRCQHSQTTINEQRRLIVCDKCNQHIEPFDFILMIASDEIRIRNNIVSLQAESRHLHQEVEELKRQRRNLKAQIKRAQKD